MPCGSRGRHAPRGEVWPPFETLNLQMTCRQIPLRRKSFSDGAPERCSRRRRSSAPCERTARPKHKEPPAQGVQPMRQAPQRRADRPGPRLVRLPDQYPRQGTPLGRRQRLPIGRRDCPAIIPHRELHRAAPLTRPGRSFTSTRPSRKMNNSDVFDLIQRCIDGGNGWICRTFAFSRPSSAKAA